MTILASYINVHYMNNEILNIMVVHKNHLAQKQVSKINLHMTREKMILFVNKRCFRSIVWLVDFHLEFHTELMHNTILMFLKISSMYFFFRDFLQKNFNNFKINFSQMHSIKHFAIFSKMKMYGSFTKIFLGMCLYIIVSAFYIKCLNLKIENYSLCKFVNT